MSCNLISSNEIFLRDQQHAARVFVDDNMRLSPKFKFLFHVSFGINPAAVIDQKLISRHRNELSVLVKSVKLPNIDIITESLNQYNRKKVVQIQQKFIPISIKFHEDNAGLVNLLWQNYYRYYYADPSVATVPGAYTRNATKNANYITVPYGLDNRSSVNFFNYIKIYQMARHQFICYTLHNPLISRWEHDQLDYSAVEPSEHSITIDYEAVSYSSGRVEPGNPEGFAIAHYDQTPSPITSAPLTEVQPVVVTPNASSINETVKQVNTAQNTKSLKNEGITGIINRAIAPAKKEITGITNTVFPTVPPVDPVQAILRRLIQ